MMQPGRTYSSVCERCENRAAEFRCETCQVVECAWCHEVDHRESANHQSWPLNRVRSLVTNLVPPNEVINYAAMTTPTQQVAKTPMPLSSSFQPASGGGLSQPPTSSSSNFSLGNFQAQRSVNSIEAQLLALQQIQNGPQVFRSPMGPPNLLHAPQPPMWMGMTANSSPSGFHMTTTNSTASTMAPTVQPSMFPPPPPTTTTFPTFGVPNGNGASSDSSDWMKLNQERYQLFIQNQPCTLTPEERMKQQVPGLYASIGGQCQVASAPPAQQRRQRDPAKSTHTTTTMASDSSRSLASSTNVDANRPVNLVGSWMHGNHPTINSSDTNEKIFTEMVREQVETFLDGSSLDHTGPKNMDRIVYYFRTIFNQQEKSSLGPHFQLDLRIRWKSDHPTTSVDSDAADVRTTLLGFLLYCLSRAPDWWSPPVAGGPGLLPDGDGRLPVWYCGTPSCQQRLCADEGEVKYGHCSMCGFHATRPQAPIPVRTDPSLPIDLIGCGCGRFNLELGWCGTCGAMRPPPPSVGGRVGAGLTVTNQKTTSSWTSSSSAPSCISYDPTSFISIYGTNQPGWGYSEAPVYCDVGLAVEFSANGFVYGLRMYDGPYTFNQHSLKLWCEDTRELMSQVSVDVDSSKPWSYGWFESPIQVRASERYLISFNVPPSGSYQSAPKTVDFAIPPEFRLQGGRRGPSGTFPTTECEAPAIDLLFSITPPPPPPPTNQSTSETNLTKTSSTPPSPLTIEEKFKEELFLPLIHGIIANLKHHPFKWTCQSLTTNSSASSSVSSVSTPLVTSSLLPLLMFSFLRPPFSHQLIPHIIQLIQVIYPDTASSHMLASISSASASSTIPRMDAQLALIRLFQQNPDFNSELLPLLRLLRQAGATTTFTTNVLSSDSPLTTQFSFGKEHTPQVNSWIYLSSWMSTQKLECILSWLIQEYESNPTNLTRLYDPTYEFDLGDGSGSHTHLAYVQRLMKFHQNNTPLQIYGQLIHRLHQLTSTHPSTSTSITSASASNSLCLLNETAELDDEMVQILESLQTATGTYSASSSSSFTSVASMLRKSLSELTQHCASARLLQRLLQINQRDHFAKQPSTLSIIHTIVTDITHLLSHSPQLFNLSETDSSGNCLFYLLLSIPTAALIRLRPHQQVLQKKISELPPHLLMNKSVIEMFSTDSIPTVSESTCKKLATAYTSSPSSHAIYPYAGVELPTNNGPSTWGPLTIGRIFDCNATQVTDLIGLQYHHPYGNYSTPSIIIYDHRTNEILMYLSPQDQRDQPRPTPGQLVTRMFPASIRINPAGTVDTPQVLICLGWHRSEIGIFERELPLSTRLITPGEILVSDVAVIDQRPTKKPSPRPITFNAAPTFYVSSEAAEPYDPETDIQRRSQQLKQHREFEAQMQQTRQRHQLIQQQRTATEPSARLSLTERRPCQCCARDSYQFCTSISEGVLPCARCRTLGELCQQQPPHQHQQQQSQLQFTCQGCRTDLTACNLSDGWPCNRCRQLGRSCSQPSLLAMLSLPSISTNTNLTVSRFTSSSTIDGHNHGQTLPTVVNRMTLVPPGLLYGNALSNKRMVLPPSFPGYSNILPLDFLLPLHSPYPRLEFIWSLYETLLTVTLNHIHTTYPKIGMDMIMHANLLGCLQTQFGSWSSSMDDTTMTELKAWIDLFQSHSIPIIVPPTCIGGSILIGQPEQCDIFGDLLRQLKSMRIREWYATCQLSTDGLWPTRAPGPCQKESLLDTLKRYQQLPQQRHQMIDLRINELLKFLQHEEERWHTVYGPMIRVMVEDVLIPDLSEMVYQYLLPSPPPPSSTTSASALTPTNFHANIFAPFHHDMPAQMLPANPIHLPSNWSYPPTVSSAFVPDMDEVEWQRRDLLNQMHQTN